MGKTPAIVTPELIRNVLATFQTGVPLANAAEMHNVSLSAILRNCEQDVDLAAELARAKEIHAHVLVGQTLEITATTLDPQRARNMVWARQWIAERLARNTYGQKVDITVDSRVSISAALEEATKRLRPGRDPAHSGTHQVIDLVPEPERTPTDSESGEVVDPFA